MPELIETDVDVAYGCVSYEGTPGVRYYATGEITAELVSGYAEQDPDTAAFVAQVNEEFAGVLQEVVAQTDVALTTLDPVTGERAVRNAETNLGDLCADAYRVLLGADVAFVNGGGVRADIAAGDITYEDIINVHPFGNEACLVETSGQAILDALEMGAHLYPEENGGFLQVSGLSYTIDASVPSSVVLSDEGAFVEVAGEYRVKDVTVGGEPLDLEGTYTLASHNYMLKSGGDGFVMFMDDTLLQDSVMIDNQVLINYIVDELGGVVGEEYADPYGQGRITVINDFTTPTQPVEEEPTEEPEAPADWADVDQDAWYAEAVNYVIENGIMGSTSTEAQVFAPNGTVTRATVFQTFYNMEGQPAVTEAASFADVAGTWYADSAAWAEDAGLTTGDGTGAYAGDRAVTRAELATIVVRYAQYKGMALTAGDLSAYTDSADVAEWASEGMSLAVGSGVLSGKDGNRLDPNGTAVRAELATILMNYANNMAPAEETDASLTLSEYLDTTDYTWFLTGKTSYAIQGKMVSASTDVYNELEDVSYTAEPNGQDVVLKGTAGEEWVTSLEKVLETYTKPDGSALTAEDFVADTYIDLQTKAEPDTNYACFIPAGTVVVVETAWGDVLTANRAEVPHGDGDYLVCTVDDEGQPNLSDVWVVNGEIFPDTYDMTNAQSSQADAA